MKNIFILIENTVVDKERLLKQMKKHFNPTLVEERCDNCLTISRDVFVDWGYIAELVGESSISFVFLDFFIENDIELDRYISSGITYFNNPKASTISLPLVKYEREVIEAKPVLFLDRDGIINVDHGYVHDFSKTEIYSDIVEVIKVANKLKIPVIITTNQAGIGRGYYTHNEVDIFHKELRFYLEQSHAHVDHIEICPFHESAGIPPWKRDSLLRKPNPGMHLKSLGIIHGTISRSLMLGDKSSDQINLEGLKSFILKGDYELDGLRDVFDSRGQLCSETVRYLNKMLDFS